MEVRLLGAMEARAAGQPLALGPPKQRAVFAALAVDAGRPVRVETLVDRVWDDPPPAEARNALYAHIMRIRRLLDRAAELDGGAARLDRRPAGYLLDLDPDRVDLHRFQRLVDQARDGRYDDIQRVTLLRQALDLWRGDPVVDLSGGWFARLRDGWQQHWLAAVVAWARTELRLGNHDAVLGRLPDLVVDHPLVEPLVAVSMQALHAAGRGAEALAHYAVTRARLAEQLGTDPGPELRNLHRAILRGEPVPAGRGTARLVPRQLPTPPPSFTGRTRELAALDRVRDAATVVISAIDGMAGVGKTALAVHTAHRIADRYPDGQLFVDLHGHTPGMSPREPGEVLDHLLRSLGVPGPQIPAGLQERAGLYRTRLADQRMLIVLDNAATEAQVAPLLPGAPGCLVLITSRHRLTGLDHTGALSLDTLPTPDGVALFERTVGRDRLGSPSTELLIEVVELCGRLPLAIRIAAARLRSHPAWNLSHLVLRLRDQEHRLAELDAGQRSVTAALDLSYRHLNRAQQDAYRLLGRHPGPDIDPYAMAALLGVPVRQAGRTVDQLLDTHLLQEPVPGRYRFHDLVRTHAAGTAGPDQAAQTEAALIRLLDHYRHTAARATAVAYPYARRPPPPDPPAGTPTVDLPDQATALDWLDAELPNLLAAARHAGTHGMTAYLPYLSATLHRHLHTRGRYPTAEVLHHQALASARTADRPTDELTAWNDLGHIHRSQGRNAEAIDDFRQALRIARATGERAGELDALAGLGDVHRSQGRYAEATDCYRQVLRIAEETDRRRGTLDALHGLGHVHRRQGRPEQAIDHLEQVLRIARETGHRPRELDALNGLGLVHRTQRRQERAAEHYRQALALARETGHHRGELDALNGLGDILRAQGRYPEAVAHFRQLLDLAGEARDRNLEFEARQGLGRIRYATGDPATAVDQHARALALADELGQPLDQARAHDGLAHAQHALGRFESARGHWQQALALLTGLGVDQTEDEETSTDAVRAHLARLDPASSE
ncbi:tetratricopeptide repeat protein [Micromonospora sp. NPDC049460]|uniref:AfsR/SARP family transcriptional regulator n=1 Tax=Micromonospora sp. NPDC049460 TaxID=3364272 RepID=UPI0037B8CF61